MTYRATLDAIQTSMSASYWLKRAAAELDQRDTIDALYDADALAKLARMRWTEVQRPAADGLVAALIAMTKPE